MAFSERLAPLAKLHPTSRPPREGGTDRCRRWRREPSDTGRRPRGRHPAEHFARHRAGPAGGRERSSRTRRGASTRGARRVPSAAHGVWTVPREDRRRTSTWAGPGDVEGVSPGPASRVSPTRNAPAPGLRRARMPPHAARTAVYSAFSASCHAVPTSRPHGGGRHGPVSAAAPGTVRHRTPARGMAPGAVRSRRGTCLVEASGWGPRRNGTHRARGRGAGPVVGRARLGDRATTPPSRPAGRQGTLVGRRPDRSAPRTRQRRRA